MLRLSIVLHDGLAAPVFVGFSTSAAAYIDRIKANPHWGLYVHGIFDDTVSDNFEYRGIKKIGTLNDLASYLDHTSLDEVAITLNLNEYNKLENIVAICEKSGVHTKFVPTIITLFPRTLIPKIWMDSQSSIFEMSL